MKTYELEFEDGNNLICSGKDIIDVVVTVASSQSNEIVKVVKIEEIKNA